MAFKSKQIVQEDKGVITLRAKFGKKQAGDIIRPVPDKATGRIYTGQGKNGVGFISKKEEEENEDGIVIDKFTPISLSEGATFDLNDPVQAALWRAAKEHPYIVLRKEDLSSHPDARYYVEDLRSEADQAIKIESTITTVKYKILNEINQEKRKSLAKVFGLESADGFSEAQLLQYLIREVESPVNAAVAEAFLKPENAEYNEALVMANELKTLGLVERGRDNMHRYGGPDGHPLGLEMSDVANYLRDPANKDFVFSIATTLDQLKQQRGLS